MVGPAIKGKNIGWQCFDKILKVSGIKANLTPNGTCPVGECRSTSFAEQIAWPVDAARSRYYAERDMGAPLAQEEQMIFFPICAHRGTVEKVFGALPVEVNRQTGVVGQRRCLRRFFQARSVCTGAARTLIEQGDTEWVWAQTILASLLYQG